MYAYLGDRARSDCHHCSLQHFALRLLWQHDAPLCYSLCCEALHKHPVKQRKEFSESLETTQRQDILARLSHYV